jgi:hypothetical protein
MPGPERSTSRLPIAGSVVALAGLNILLVAIGPGAVTSERSILGSALLWLSMYPTYRYLRSTSGRIPYLPAMAVFYFCCYGLPAFTDVQRVGDLRIDETQVIRALELALGGEALLFVAFYVFSAAWLPKVRLPLDLPRMSGRLLVAGYFCILVRTVLLRVEVSSGLQQLAGFIMTLPALLAGGLLLCWMRGQLSRTHKLLGAVLVAFIVLTDVATASMAPVAMTLATLIFVAMAEKRRVPLLILVLGLIVVILGLGTKGDYRRELSHRSEADFMTRMEIYFDVQSAFYSGEGRTLAKAGTVAQSRIDHLSSFAFVVQKTPSEVPYWNGGTYAGFWWSFVPRLLVPDKPRKQLGQEYGHRYHFIHPSDHQTSINLEQTVEMYANFGTFGVLLGMFLLGYLYRALYTVLNHEGAGDGGILVAAGLFRLLLNIESDFSLVFGGILQAAVLTYITLRVLAVRRRTRPIAIAA